MDPTTVDAVQMAGTAATGATDMTLFALFMQADLIVKLVMTMLFCASIWCWAIVIDKGLRMRRLNSSAGNFEENFWSGGSLESLFDRLGRRPEDPMAATFAAGMREWKHANEHGLTQGGMKANLQQRIERVMAVTIGREMSVIERQMIVLASIGSVSPFVGLFGTVWGIMHAFDRIAQQGNTSLVTVAPPIAEALFATALGLVAAIPAVVAYNKFSSDIGRYSERLDQFAHEFLAILSRHLEERT